MNMDLAEIPFGDDDDSRMTGGGNDGKYLIAAGQDQVSPIRHPYQKLYIEQNTGNGGKFDCQIQTIVFVLLPEDKLMLPGSMVIFMTRI